VGVFFHDPYFFVDAPDVPERAGTRIIHHVAQVIVVILKRFFAHNDVPAAGKRPQHEAAGAWFAELKGDRVGIDDLDLADGREQRLPGHADALGGPDDARECGMHIFGREVGSVVEFHPLTQVKRVGLAVGGDVPVRGKIGDDRPAVAGITADEVVIHRPLRTQVGNGPRLVDIEVSRGTMDGIAQGSPGFRLRFRSAQLEHRRRRAGAVAR
jgi:hypothetical protein